MKKIGLLLMPLMAVSLLASCGNNKNSTRIIYGNIITMDESNPTAEAIAIKDGKIAAVGSRQDIAKYVTGNAQVDNLGKDAYVYPGLVDAHTHFAVMTTMLCGGIFIPVEGPHEKGDLDAYANIMKDFIDKNPGKEVYQGMGFWITDEKPTATKLDSICGPDKPIVIVGGGGHDAWLNTAAINKFIGDTPTKVNAWIEKVGEDCVTTEPKGGYTHGYPTGYVYETARFNVTDQIKHNKDDIKQMILAFQEQALNYGYTTVCDCSMVENEFNQQVTAFEELEKEGKLKLKFRAYCDITEYSSQEQRDDIINRAVEYRKKYKGDKFQIIGIKIFLDGVYEAHSAYTLKEYPNPETIGKEAGYRGIGRWRNMQDELNRVVKKSNENDLAVHIHAMGDAAIRQCLDAFEYSAEQLVPADQKPNFRNAIAHCGLVDRTDKDENGRTKGLTDLQRFGALGVSAVVAPHWSPTGTLAYPEELKCVGEETRKEMFLIKSFINEGANVAFHTDSAAPFGAPEMIFDATTRLDAQHMSECVGIRGEDELIDSKQALKCLTINSAYSARSEDHVGCIKIGMDADFTVYNKDYTDNSVATNWYEFKDAKLMALYVNGTNLLGNQ